MRLPFSDLRFRTRLALVMLLTLGLTSAALMYTYLRQNRRIKAYVTGVTSDLVVISQVAQERIPPDADRSQAIAVYEKALKDAGLSYTLTSPTGEVVASTTPGQVGKKIKLKKRPPEVKKDLIQFSANFPDVGVDSSVEQKTYSVEFPIIQMEKSGDKEGSKVIGYAQVRGVGDQVAALMNRNYQERLTLILLILTTSIFAVVYLASRFTRPISMLVMGAEQVAGGNLYVALPVEGTDEMGRLAATFNRMVERLRENRQLQERLNEAGKLSLLGRFAATVAHEVRNSLNFMNLSIDQIRAKHSGGDEKTARDLQRNLSNIKDEINRLNHLVTGFLTAGRQAPPELMACDLRGTLEQAVALVEKQAHNQDIAMTTEFPEECPILQADAAQLKTCFLNILTNAIQAMPCGGEIRLTARCVTENGNAGSVELRFADTGPGIPREDREKIFAPFFSTKPTGFGLGLAITKKILEEHGGRIRVTDAERRGTVIVVELPLFQPSVSHAPVAAAPPVA